MKFSQLILAWKVLANEPLVLELLLMQELAWLIDCWMRLFLCLEGLIYSGGDGQASDAEHLGTIGLVSKQPQH